MQKLLDLETERILLTKQVAEVEAQKEDVCAMMTLQNPGSDLLQKLENRIVKWKKK